MILDSVFFRDLVGILVKLISLFDGKEIAFLIALLILFVSLLLWFIWIGRLHRRFISKLRQVASKLSNINSAPNTSSEDKLASADELFEKFPMLAKPWRLYRPNVRVDERLNALINLTDPRSLFSLEALPGRGYEKWASTLSGVFLTIGLLFTFIGLSAALLRVGTFSANPAQMRDAINSILDISSAKFITSIAGIIAYIQWSLISRYYSRDQASAADKLLEEIQRLSRFVTPEYLLFEQSVIAQKQLDRLDRFTDDLAVAVDRSLDRFVGARLDQLPDSMGAVMQGVIENGVTSRLDRMPETLGNAVREPLNDAMKPVSDALARFGASIGRTNEDALQGMMTSFLQELKGSAGQEMKSVGTAVEDVAKVLSTIKGHLDESGKNFGSEMGFAAQRLLEAANRMDQSIAANLEKLGEPIAHIESVLKSNAQSLTGVGGQITQTVEAGLQAAVTALLEATKRAGGEAEASLRQQMGVLSAAVSEVADQVASVIEQTRRNLVDGTSGAAAALGAGASEAGRAMGEAATRMANDLQTASEAAASRVVLAADALGARVDQTISGLGRLADGTDAQVSRLDVAGKRLIDAGDAFLLASEAVQKAVSPIESSLRTIEASLAQVRSAVDAHAAVDASARKALDHLGQLAQQSASTFASQDRRLGELDGALERTVLGVRDGVIQLSDTMAKAFRDYDREMSKAVGSLSNAIEGFVELLDEIQRDASRR